MGTSDKMLGGNLRWTSIPSRGSSNTPSRLHAMETGISSGSVGQFGPSMTFTYMYSFIHWVDRATNRVKSFAQEHNTRTRRPGLNLDLLIQSSKIV